MLTNSATKVYIIDIQFKHAHTATCMDGDVKLVGSNSNSEGRLEVCFDQRWTTVDDDGWTDSDTKVACRQLGLSTSGIITAYFPWLYY